MKEKVCLLVTLILSLFLFSGKVEAAKELTCIYETGGGYKKMIVQNSDGDLQLFFDGYHDDLDMDSTKWIEHSEMSDTTITFIYGDKKNKLNLVECPDYSSKYTTTITEFYFYDETEMFRDEDALVAEADRLPEILSEDYVAPEDDPNATKCTYFKGDDGTFTLYFNNNELSYKSQRTNVSGPMVRFELEDIKNSYGLTCPVSIYEYYVDPNTGDANFGPFAAEYHLSKPTITGTICDAFSGICSQYYLNELTLDGDNSTKEELEDIGSIFGDDVELKNCEDLLGPEAIELINDAMNIVRIIVPILLLVLGILDFTKATFSGSADDMTKVKKTFINRIIAAVVVFLIPIFVNLLLTLANEVWGYINPTSCIK